MCEKREWQHWLPTIIRCKITKSHPIIKIRALSPRSIHHAVTKNNYRPSRVKKQLPCNPKRKRVIQENYYKRAPRNFPRKTGASAATTRASSPKLKKKATRIRYASRDFSANGPLKTVRRPRKRQFDFYTRRTTYSIACKAF